MAMRAIDLNERAKPVAVDRRISLPYYYRIAENLLRQASIYREEKNLIDLYTILLRYSSLLVDTIPSHPDYPKFNSKEKSIFKKKLLDVITELETIKTDVQRQADEVNKGRGLEPDGLGGGYTLSPAKKQLTATPQDHSHIGNATAVLYTTSTGRPQEVSQGTIQPERQLQKFSVSLPYPKAETLSRHSILGPGGLGGQRTEPVTGIRVQYPSYSSLTQGETSSLLPYIANQDGRNGPITTFQDNSRKSQYDIQSVLALDDGRWSIPVESPTSLPTNVLHEQFSQLNIRQPTPPPVLAQVQAVPTAIPPSQVADPRPGPAISDPGRFQDLHVPVKLMECFLRVAEANTKKNLETCGVLTGSLKNRTFYVTTLIIPKQTSTSDSCQATNEEEIFEVQDKKSLFTLGWIHTHPTQTCFLSSIDLHNHYSYQVMLPEAIAIVMAPTDTTRTHGIFHLTDPGGMGVIHDCQQTGFHPHEEPLDGSAIYEHCSHVYMNPSVKFDFVDLRNS